MFDVWKLQHKNYSLMCVCVRVFVCVYVTKSAVLPSESQQRLD